MTALANNQLSGYSYDAAGNMTHDATTGTNYSYDQENRVTGAAGYAYTYDADGNRVEKSNGSTGTIYWYMAPGIVAESDLSGNLQSEYVFFDGERVARKDFPGGAVSYYFSDHLKTASVITDSAGIIKEDEDFYPWGGELQFVNGDSNHYKFSGKERDNETGLDYFGVRHYANWLGRFITPDWSSTPVPVPYADLGDPQSLNQYSYVRNIPTSRTDPEGHDGFLATVLVYATAGAEDGAEVGATAGSVEPGGGTLLGAGGGVVVGGAIGTVVGLGVAVWDHFFGAPSKTTTVPTNTPAATPTTVVPAPTSKTLPATGVSTIPAAQTAEHTKGARPSTATKHQEGRARAAQDRGGEKGDARRSRPRKPPKGWKQRKFGNKSGKWPPTNPHDQGLANRL